MEQPVQADLAPFEAATSVAGRRWQLGLFMVTTLTFSSTEKMAAVIESFLRVIETKDWKLRRHCERVAVLAGLVTSHLPLTEAERQLLRHGALLHDIGNIGIPDTILLKPGGLTEVELDEVKLHPIIGEYMVSPLESCDAIRPFIRSHHEKLDGSGYPDGLIGDEIPRLVHILSVIDVYDSLRSERAYRHAFTHEEALRILRKEVIVGWWNADIVDLLAQRKVAESALGSL